MYMYPYTYVYVFQYTGQVVLRLLRGSHEWVLGLLIGPGFQPHGNFCCFIGRIIGEFTMALQIVLMNPNFTYESEIPG